MNFCCFAVYEHPFFERFIQRIVAISKCLYILKCQVFRWHFQVAILPPLSDSCTFSHYLYYTKNDNFLSLYSPFNAKRFLFCSFAIWSKWFQHLLESITLQVIVYFTINNQITLIIEFYFVFWFVVRGFWFCYFRIQHPKFAIYKV